MSPHRDAGELLKKCPIGIEVPSICSAGSCQRCADFREGWDFGLLQAASHGSAGGEIDIEHAFIEVCDELGCAYDNESQLIEIANLRQRAGLPRSEVRTETPPAPEYTAALVARLRNTDLIDDFARLDAADLIERLSRAAQAPGVCPLCGGELEQGKQRYCPSCGTHDEAPAQASWMPLDTAPKDGRHILIIRTPPYSATGNIYIAFWHDGRNTPAWVAQGSGLEMDTRIWNRWRHLPGEEYYPHTLAAPPAQACKEPLRYCDYCSSWNSKPCGEGCIWRSSMPTVEEAKQKIITNSKRTPSVPSADREAGK